MSPSYRPQLGIFSQPALAAAFRKLTGKPERLAQTQAGLTATFPVPTILPTWAEKSRPDGKPSAGTEPLTDYVTKVGCCRCTDGHFVMRASLCAQRISRKSKHFHILEPFMRVRAGLFMSFRGILVGGSNP
jgi:hypothetical protein